MIRKEKLLTYGLGITLLAGVWAVANAGPTTPPEGPVSPTPAALQTIDAKIDQISGIVGNGTPGNPTTGATAFITMVAGEAPNARIAVSDFSYGFETPFVFGSPARTGPLPIVLEGEGLTSAFLPLAIASLDAQLIPQVRVDICPMQNSMVEDDCVMTIELLGVTVESSGAVPGENNQRFTLVAERVRTVYREFDELDRLIATYEHTWDFVNNQPF